jgi:hypothetical protein
MTLERLIYAGVAVLGIVTIGGHLLATVGGLDDVLMRVFN